LEFPSLKSSLKHRPGEIYTAKVTSCEVNCPSKCDRHVSESCPLEIPGLHCLAAELRITEIRPIEIRPTELRSIEFDPPKIRVTEVSPSKIYLVETCVAEIQTLEILTAEICAHEDNPAEVHSFEVDLSKIRINDTRSIAAPLIPGFGLFIENPATGELDIGIESGLRITTR
jgi:hypothetical protein